MRACHRCGSKFQPVHSRHRFCSSECRRGKVVLAHRVALEKQIEAMATGIEHRALVESCRALADLVDSLDHFDALVWREYRLALKALGEAVTDGGSDPTDEFLVDLRASIRHTENAGS